MDFIEYSGIPSFFDALGRVSADSPIHLEHVAWRGTDLDQDCATEFRFLAGADGAPSVMLTLPRTDRTSQRYREISQAHQLSHLLKATDRLPRIGGWEHQAESGSMTWTEGMFRLFEADPAMFVPTSESIASLFAPETMLGPRPGRNGLESVDCETEATTCRGRKIWIHVVGQFELRDGVVIRSHGAVQDVTAERTARNTLSRITDWLKLSMRAAHMYAWRWMRATDEFELVLPEDAIRYLPPDFRGMEAFFSRVHPEDHDRLSASTQLALKDCVEFKEEFRFRVINDVYRWFAVAARPLLDEMGSVVGLVGAAQDVTSRHTEPARVGEYGELLRSATASTSDVLLLLDSNLTVRFCNRAIGARPPQELIGLPLQEALHSSGWPAHSQLLASVLATGESVTFGHEAPGDDGTTHRYESRAIPTYDKGVISGVSVTISDITERMHLEREVLEVSAREQQRIGQDLHDGLGQELTGVSLMLRSLATKVRREYPNASSEVEEIIAVVNHSIESARSLARGLSPLNTHPGGLVHALRALVVRARELYGLDVRFRSKVWPQITLDEAQGSHLYRIAQEALTNVARHAKATQVDVRLQVSERRFTLTITDDGVGLDRSFKSASGMGLKLMAYRASMVGAKLEIAPNEPKGTIVRVSGEQPAVV